MVTPQARDCWDWGRILVHLPYLQTDAGVTGRQQFCNKRYMHGVQHAANARNPHAHAIAA
jgi:hypothetical protein